MECLKTDSLDAAVTALFGDGVRVAGRYPVYGGDINRSYRLSLSDGSALFMKCNTMRNLPFFTAEAQGLAALRGSGAVGVPNALAAGTDQTQDVSFLLMEYLESATRISRYWEVFGREMAALHRADCSKLASASGSLPFGFAADNYIGASPQKNTPAADWLTFFRDCRLLPQFKMAERYFDPGTRRQFERLLDRLDSRLTEPEFPSLIHGDLWSGNAVCGPDGKTWILDPAAYVGHFEAELAMTELFGGFPSAFYGAYHEVNPIGSGYRDRRDLYNLYHILNHLNLFGGSYLSSVRQILNRYS